MVIYTQINQKNILFVVAFVYGHIYILNTGRTCLCFVTWLDSELWKWFLVCHVLFPHLSHCCHLLGHLCCCPQHSGLFTSKTEVPRGFDLIQVTLCPLWFYIIISKTGLLVQQDAWALGSLLILSKYTRKRFCVMCLLVRNIFDHLPPECPWHHGHCKTWKVTQW
jgi:hypothetical protein